MAPPSIIYFLSLPSIPDPSSVTFYFFTIHLPFTYFGCILSDKKTLGAVYGG